MNKRLLIFSLAALTAAASPVFSSEEEYLNWQSVSVQCKSQEAGKISCEIAVGDKGYSKFVIEAFGKSHVLTPPQLAKLAEFPLSSLHITHEAGYEMLGGYTVHFRLDRTYYDASKKLISEIVYVSVTKRGLEVSEPRKKEN